MSMGGYIPDTDVMVYKSFDSILCHKCVFGFEEEQYVATSFMACEPQHPFNGKVFLFLCYNLSFYEYKDGKIIPGTRMSENSN